MITDFVPTNFSEQPSDILELNEAIQHQTAFTELGQQILAIREFNPEIDKGVYLTGENHHRIYQAVLLLENLQSIEVFAKFIEDEQKAHNELEAYRRCNNAEIPTLNFLASINTQRGFCNITRTENYLIPYSRLKIDTLEKYRKMLMNGSHAISMIHGANIFHRDTLTRNIATLSNQPHRHFVFDFESSEPMSLDNPLSHTQKQQDLELFQESLFFQLVKQNPENGELITGAESIVI